MGKLKGMFGARRVLVELALAVRLVPCPLLLAADTTAEGDGWAAETSIRKVGPRVEAVWEIRLSRSRFNPENFQELRKLWNAASLLDSDIAQFMP